MEVKRNLMMEIALELSVFESFGDGSVWDLKIFNEYLIHHHFQISPAAITTNFNLDMDDPNMEKMSTTASTWESLDAKESVPPQNLDNALDIPTPPALDSKSVDEEDTRPRDWRFWMVFMALSFTGLLSTLEATVTSTALPTILAELDVGDKYSWVINVYFLTSMIFQPLFGQLANIFGRRWLMIASVAILVLGSGICGGATNGSMLIAGRTVQGIGGGGISVFIELIVCDLVPLRERGNFMGLLMATMSLGTAVGPVIGGVIVQHSSWRWIFYLNLPIGGATLVLLVAFLQVHHKKESTLGQKLKRIDWIGNAILVTSLIAILVALTDAGTKAPWSSYRIIVPLTLGLCGLIVFVFYEGSSFCVEPTVPLRLFSNRTSLTAYILVFIWTLCTIWVIYFLPVYFQAVMGSTPSRSGVQILPTITFLLPFAILSGLAVTKFGRYRPIHFAGFACIIIGFGLFTLLDSTSSTAEWVIFQAISAAGVGAMGASLLPAAQASLEDSDSASSTATFAFMRSFGAVWGLAIPGAIFNNQFDAHAYKITNEATRALFTNGKAFSHAEKAFIYSFVGEERQQIIEVYENALKVVWVVGAVISGVAFFGIFAEKEIKLRTKLESEFGMKKEKIEGGDNKEGVVGV